MTPILVAGAGPAGLTLAIELARRGQPCRIVDENASRHGHSRAIVLQPRSLEVFAALGVADEIFAAGHPIHGAEIYASCDRLLHVSFDELESLYPFAIDVLQNETERVLESRLNALGVFIERRTTVCGLQQDKNGVSVFLRRADGSSETVRASWVVGCDGANSTVRHASAMMFEDPWMTETFVTADAQVEWDLPNDECYVWFHEDGWLSAFPLRDRRWRIVADTGQDSPPMADVFARRCPVQAKLVAVEGQAVYRVPSRRLSSYQQGRVFVAGDAAHVQSPAAGQGLNTAIQDAFNLGWKLAAVEQGLAPAALLESYTVERTPIAAGVLELNDQLSRIAAIRRPISQKIRSRLIPILASFDVIEQRLNQRVAGTGANYRKSPVVSESGPWNGGPCPGDRIHIPASGRHELILYACGVSENDKTNFDQTVRYMQDGYSELIDTQFDHESPGPRMMLIRPDGYLAFRSSGSDPLPLLTYLSRHYAIEA